MQRLVVVVLFLFVFTTPCFAAFSLGVNLPWIEYARDYGTNAWGYTGIAANPAAIDSIFNDAATNSAPVIRLWVFGDARAGISIDANGNAVGLDAKVFADMDAMFEKARARNVKIVMVLFDFGLLNNAQQVNGVQSGGRSSWLSNAAQRDSLITNVVVPVLQRYSQESSIYAWEIMNEPEWIISDLPLPAVNSGTTPVNVADFYAFASAIASAVHSNTNAKVTLGSASLKWHVIWTNSYASDNGHTPLNLDFYQSHYYSWMDNNPIDDPVLGTFSQSPKEQNKAGLNLDKEMIIGEFQAGTDIQTILDALKNNGYDGAWPWSVTADFIIDSNIWGLMKAWAAANISPNNPTTGSSNNNNNGSGASRVVPFLASLFI